jgi:hypothetical protein
MVSCMSSQKKTEPIPRKTRKNRLVKTLPTTLVGALDLKLIPAPVISPWLSLMPAPLTRENWRANYASQSLLRMRRK